MSVTGGDKLVRPIAFLSSQLNWEPTMNVFYDSGKKKGAMGLTTIYGDLACPLSFTPRPSYQKDSSSSMDRIHVDQDFLVW